MLSVRGRHRTRHSGGSRWSAKDIEGLFYAVRFALFLLGIGLAGIALAGRSGWSSVPLGVAMVALGGVGLLVAVGGLGTARRWASKVATARRRNHPSADQYARPAGRHGERRTAQHPRADVDASAESSAPVDDG